MASGELTRTSVTTNDIVAKLWNLCHVLRDDGITYNEYVTELTYLLFLKMLAETGHEEKLPKEYRWSELAKRTGLDQLTYYRQLMLDLGDAKKTKDKTVLAIFADAQTKLRKPTNLKSLTTDIDQLDWFSAREEGLGNLYEGLLEKNAAEKKSGAGQYFTPRPLIDGMVRLMKPQPGEVIQDPAAGTGGFIVAADRFIKDATDDLFKLPKDKAAFQRRSAYTGSELVPDTHRLLLMNLMLHGIECPIESGDSLSPSGEGLGKADLILTNPPFGTKKGGGRPTRADFSITADTSNKQLAFVEHIVRALKPGGRAAVVLPDSACDTHAANRNHETTANGFLSLGARSVLGSVFPLLAKDAAIFAARLLHRLAKFVPAAINTRGRAITWTEVVSGLLRMQLLTDFLRRLEQRNEISHATYEEIHIAGNMAINTNQPDPFAHIATLLEKKGVDDSKLKLVLETAVANSSTLSYLNVGRPETILLDTIERSKKMADLLRGNRPPGDLFASGIAS